MKQTAILKTTRTDIAQVDPRNIIIEEGFNKRIDYGDIDALALSVVSVGVLEPVEGYKVRGEDKYVMTDGHRRHAACMLALENHKNGKPGFEDISKIKQIKLVPSSSNFKDRMYTMAITGEGKKPLTDIEKANMYAALIQIGLEEGKKRTDVIKEIVAKLGVSQAAVYNTLKIDSLPDVIKQRIIANEISGGTVVDITRELKDPEQQIKAVERAIATAQASSRDGKVVKATSKDVKGLKSKSPMARIQEVMDKLDDNKVSNARANALRALLQGLVEKQPLKELYELFI